MRFELASNMVILPDYVRASLEGYTLMFKAILWLFSFNVYYVPHLVYCQILKTKMLQFINELETCLVVEYLVPRNHILLCTLELKMRKKMAIKLESVSWILHWIIQRLLSKHNESHLLNWKLTLLVMLISKWGMFCVLNVHEPILGCIRYTVVGFGLTPIWHIS